MPQRKRIMQPPPGYITAKAAKRMLGNVSDGMLRYYVTKNLIDRFVPSDRAQGFYKLEDVKRVAEKNKEYMPKRSIKFSRGTIDDLRTCDRVLDHAFGEGPWSNPLERRTTWLEKNPNALYVLKVDSEVVGCIFLLPLTQHKVEQIQLSESTPGIYADEILEYIPGARVHLYALSACVYASDGKNTTKRFYGSRLVNGLLREIVALGKQGVIIETIAARTRYVPGNPYKTKDGLNLLQGIGFAEVESITSHRNFEIDVRRSGIPGILAYKQALREWQAAHATTPLVSPHSTAPAALRSTEKIEPRAGPVATQPPNTITLQELADELGINRSTLHEQVMTHHLEHIAIPLSELGKPGKGEERFFTVEQVARVKAWRATRRTKKQD